MHIYRCHLNVRSPLFFESRSLGRLAETLPVLHNYALTYTIAGLLGLVPLRTSLVVPEAALPHPLYHLDLPPLNELGLYVTPAAPIAVSFLTNTIKMEPEGLYRSSEAGSGNVRSYTAIKQIAPESTLVCYVLSREPLARIPSIIEVGQWLSSVRVRSRDVPLVVADGPYSAACPLNLLDIPETTTLDPLSGQVISMRPCSLIDHASCIGPHYVIPAEPGLEIRGGGLPVGLRYEVPVPDTALGARTVRR